MKKTLFIIISIIITYVIIGNVVVANNIIPDDAIRIRIIPNSNSEYDQNIKYKVKETMENDMKNLLTNVKNIDDARNIIKNNLDGIQDNISKTLQKNDYDLPFNVNFGFNYFPKKEFKGIVYKEGYYESVVVTLGSGLGDNWWCVLFPPLCMIEAEESADLEYTTMVKSIIDKYF